MNTETKWLTLMCATCGHWTKGPTTKADVAAWLRVHRDPRIQCGTVGVTCESTCPHPCGT